MCKNKTAGYIVSTIPKPILDAIQDTYTDKMPISLNEEVREAYERGFWIATAFAWKAWGSQLLERDLLTGWQETHH